MWSPLPKAWHEFSIYTVVMPIKSRVCLIEHYGIYTRPLTVKKEVIRPRIHPSLYRHYHPINTELVTMLSSTAFMAQLAGHRTRFVRLRVRFPAAWPKVALLSAYLLIHQQFFSTDTLNLLVYSVFWSVITTLLWNHCDKRLSHTKEWIS